MHSLKHHKPSDDSWYETYEERLGEDKLKKIDNWTYTALQALKPGTYYDIVNNIPEKYQDLFVKLCINYIEDHNDYLFSDDYTKIHRLRPITFQGKTIWIK